MWNSGLNQQKSGGMIFSNGFIAMIIPVFQVGWIYEMLCSVIWKKQMIFWCFQCNYAKRLPGRWAGSLVLYIHSYTYIYIYTDGCMYVIWLVVWNIVYLPIYWEQWYQLTNIVQRGWNHQRVMLCCVMLCCVVLCCVVLCSVSYAMQCNLMSCHVMQCKYVCNVM